MCPPRFGAASGLTVLDAGVITGRFSQLLTPGACSCCPILILTLRTGTRSAQKKVHLTPPSVCTDEMSRVIHFPASPRGPATPTKSRFKSPFEPLHVLGHLRGGLPTDDQRDKQLSDPVPREVQLDRQPRT